MLVESRRDSTDPSVMDKHDFGFRTSSNRSEDFYIFPTERSIIFYKLDSRRVQPQDEKAEVSQIHLVPAGAEQVAEGGTGCSRGASGLLHLCLDFNSRHPTGLPQNLQEPVGGDRGHEEHQVAGLTHPDPTCAASCNDSRSAGSHFRLLLMSAEPFSLIVPLQVLRDVQPRNRTELRIEVVQGCPGASFFPWLNAAISHCHRFYSPWYWIRINIASQPMRDMFQPGARRHSQRVLGKFPRGFSRPRDGTDHESSAGCVTGG